MSLHESILRMDPAELEAFRRRLRRRYSPSEIVEELRGCAARLGKSPTMREFAADPEVRVHPHTVIEHFGSWNAGKREAGLVPRRFASRRELLAALRTLGDDLGRRPTAADIEARRGAMPSRAIYTREFGSLRKALRAAGFDAPCREERLARSVELGAAFRARTGRLPSFREWDRIRRNRDDVLSAWQIYRMFDANGGAWSTFQFAVERASAGGVETAEQEQVFAAA